MKKIIDFGKIDFNGCGRKINRVRLSVELRTNNGIESLSVCGEVWNSRNTDCVTCGQCLDSILPFFKGNTQFETIYDLWKKYHLNDLNAGTHKQTEALKKQFGNLSADNYEKHCEYLKSIGLYEDKLAKGETLSYKGKNTLKKYAYGTGWICYEIPEDDLKKIKNILES